MIEVRTRKVGRTKLRVKSGFADVHAANEFMRQTYIWSDVKYCELWIDGILQVTIGHGGGDGSDHSKGDSE
jgi:hypothetical protein